MIGSVLDIVPRAVLEFHGLCAPETAKLTLNLTIGANVVQVFIDFAEPDIWYGTSVWAADKAIGTVRSMLEVTRAGHTTVVTDLTLMVTVLALLGHMLRELMTWECLLTPKWALN